MNLSPHPFSLRQLQYFVAVADALSFRQAAERCHVSQPSLSAQLAQLEDALGVRLFERSTKHVMLTRAGDELLHRARRLLVEADDLGVAARTLGDPLKGQLRVGVIPTVSPYLLPAIAPALAKKFGALAITWVEDKTHVLLASLEAGTLDAAVLALDPGMEQLAQVPLAKDAFLCAMPKSHPLAQKKSALPLSALAHEKVLLLDDGHCLREQALAVCRTARAEELEFRATSIPTLVQMVAAGRGVTLLPRLALDTELKRADLITRPFEKPAPHRALGLVWRKSSPLDDALLQLAEVMRRAYPVGEDRLAR